MPRQLLGRLVAFSFLALSLLAFILGYFLPSIRFYTDFNLNTFDYAILYEGVMRFAYGESTFLHTRGVHALADNQEYWQFFWVWAFLFPIPHLAILISHSLIFLAAAAVMFRAFFRKNIATFSILTLAFFLHPVPYRMAADIVHAEAFNFLLVPFLILTVFNKQKRASLVLTLLICLVKEDSCLYVAYFWIVYSIFHYKEWKTETKLMSLRLGIPIAAFLLNYFMVLPFFLEKTCQIMNIPFVAEAARPVNPWFEEFFQAQNKVMVFFEHLITPQCLKYLGLSLWPLIFYRRKYLWLAVASTGQVFLNILSGVVYLNSQVFHYDHVSFPVMWMGLLFSFADRPRKMLAGLLALVVLALSITFSKTIDFIERPRIWNEFDRGFVIEKADSVREIERLHAELKDEFISADFISTAYLQKQKRAVSQFPNTLQNSYYGVRSCDRYPKKPDLIILNEFFQTPENLQILMNHGYVDDPRSANFQRFRIWKLP